MSDYKSQIDEFLRGIYRKTQEIVTAEISNALANLVKGGKIVASSIPVDGSTVHVNGSGQITATGSGGTVTSVGVAVASYMTVSGSPITSSGTITIGFDTQTANKVFAGPTTSSSAPTFRLLVAGDIPTLDASKITSGTFAAARVPIATTSTLGGMIADGITITIDGTGKISAVSSGFADITLTEETTPANPASGKQTLFLDSADHKLKRVDHSGPVTTIEGGGGGSGTVTSVGLSITPGWLTAGGTPVTTSGTLTITATAGQTANSFVATPDGSTGAVSLRTIAAGDLPLGSSSAFGALKVDNVSLQASAGVASVKSQSLSAQLGADVTVSNTPWTDVLSISVPAGTWVAIASGCCYDGSFASFFTGRIYDSTNSATLASGQATVVTATYPEQMCIVAKFTLSGTATVKFQAATTTGGGSPKMKAAAPNNGSGNNATNFVIFPG